MKFSYFFPIFFLVFEKRRGCMFLFTAYKYKRNENRKKPFVWYIYVAILISFDVIVIRQQTRNSSKLFVVELNSEQ